MKNKRESPAEVQLRANVTFAQTQQLEVNRLVAQSNEILPHVTPQMEAAASDYIREQFENSQAMSENAVHLAHSGGSRDSIQLLIGFAR